MDLGLLLVGLHPHKLQLPLNGCSSQLGLLQSPGLEEHECIRFYVQGHRKVRRRQSIGGASHRLWTMVCPSNALFAQSLLTPLSMLYSAQVNMYFTCLTFRNKLTDQYVSSSFATMSWYVIHSYLIYMFWLYCSVKCQSTVGYNLLHKTVYCHIISIFCGKYTAQMCISSLEGMYSQVILCAASCMFKYW